MIKKLIPIFLFITITRAHIYNGCDINTQNRCLDKPYCQWCNNTKLDNISYSCRLNTKCFYDNKDCVTNIKFDRMCLFLTIFTNMVLLFILLCSICYISNLTRKIIDRYFDIPENNGEALSERYKEKALILTIVNMLLFVPSIVFWVMGNITFMYYFMFIMVLIIILGCSETTNKYYRYNKKINKKSVYEQIN